MELQTFLQVCYAAYHLQVIKYHVKSKEILHMQAKLTIYIHLLASFSIHYSGKAYNIYPSTCKFLNSLFSLKTKNDFLFFNSTLLQYYLKYKKNS